MVESKVNNAFQNMRNPYISCAFNPITCACKMREHYSKPKTIAKLQPRFPPSWNQQGCTGQMGSALTDITYAGSGPVTHEFIQMTIQTFSVPL